jgi:hypothetical protein
MLNITIALSYNNINECLFFRTWWSVVSVIFITHLPADSIIRYSFNSRLDMFLKHTCFFHPLLFFTSEPNGEAKQAKRVSIVYEPKLECSNYEYIYDILLHYIIIINRLKFSS